MAKHTVYTPDGKAVEMEPVDARECVAHCGYSYNHPSSEENNPATSGMDAQQGDPGTGEPSAGDPAEAAPAVEADAKPAKAKK
jgi:hypothetical protein